MNKNNLRKQKQESYAGNRIDADSNTGQYFVYLKNPLEYRRQLLESSRKIIFSLKNHQRILLLRQKKIDELKKLRASIKELLYLNRKFNEKLPKYDAKMLGVSAAEKSAEPKVQIAKIRKPVIPAVQEKTELDRLEESLMHIEDKLKNLQ